MNYQYKNELYNEVYIRTFIIAIIKMTTTRSISYTYQLISILFNMFMSDVYLIEHKYYYSAIF